ncbi:MAG: membrane protein DedA with SNARE-associated domain, partial [Myxococcota bacterium]
MDVVAELTQALTRFGPALLGVMTFFETSSLFGLFVPAGVAFLLASFLATQGTFSLKLVVAWAVAG